jgi:hypothetical protein
MRPGSPRAAHIAPSARPGASFDAERARLLAVRVHGGQREPSGALLIAHIRRVALATPEFARPVAWMHELLEWTSVAERSYLRSVSPTTNCARCGC